MGYKYRITNVTEGHKDGPHAIFISEAGKKLEPGQTCFAHRLQEGTKRISESGLSPSDRKLRVDEGDFVGDEIDLGGAKVSTGASEGRPYKETDASQPLVDPRKEPPKPKPVGADDLDGDLGKKAEPVAASTETDASQPLPASMRWGGDKAAAGAAAPLPGATTDTAAKPEGEAKGGKGKKGEAKSEDQDKGKH